jgi:hypothetical protein
MPLSWLFRSAALTAALRLSRLADTAGRLPQPPPAPRRRLANATTRHRERLTATLSWSRRTAGVVQELSRNITGVLL